MRKSEIAHLPADIRRNLKKWPCRYCENMVQVSRPREKYVGGCKFGLRPKAGGKCPKFKLAKCFQK